jgi:hypothetical protein
MHPINKLRASSFCALAKCGVWSPFPMDTALTKAGNDRHHALQQLVQHGKRSAVDALASLGDREGVEWAASHIEMHTTDGAPQEWEKSAKLVVDDVTVTGRWDMAQVAGGEAKLFDLKNQFPGEGKDYLPQMKVYSEMLMTRDDLRQVEVHILYAAPQVAKVVTITRKEAEHTIIEVIENVRKAEATPCGYCNWCRRSATCPALAEAAITVAKEFSHELEMYEPKYLTDPVHLARALRLAYALKPWLNEVERLCKEHILDGGQLEGFKTVERAAPTKVADLNAAFNAMELPAEVFIKCCSITLGKLYDTVANTTGVSRAAAKRDVQTRLADVLVTGTKYKYLAKSYNGK